MVLTGNEAIQCLLKREAPRPNRASRAFRHAQIATRQFIQQRWCRVDMAPRRYEDTDGHLPLCAIELLLANLDIRGNEDLVTARSPARPCPTSADELYDRLIRSREVARRGRSHRGLRLLARSVLESCEPPARPGVTDYVTLAELPWLLAPVLDEVEGCLRYVDKFRARLDLEAEGRRADDDWQDLSHLRERVFRLTGFWPRDVENDREAWAFGLPEDLTRLLYPQCNTFSHAEMASNLEKVIIGPTCDKLVKLKKMVLLAQTRVYLLSPKITITL
jgi:hypothetical protein